MKTSKNKKAQMRSIITIGFEDHGQDFLEWDIDNKGNIIESRPCQSWMWCQYRVTNHARLPIDGFVNIRRGKDELITIKYPIDRISTKSMEFVGSIGGAKP